jgi:hypothetical protein
VLARLGHTFRRSLAPPTPVLGPQTRIRLIDGRYPLLLSQLIDEGDGVEGPLPVHDEEQLLRVSPGQPRLLDDLGRPQGELELSERAVDQPQLVEGVLADEPGSATPSVGSADRPSSHIIATSKDGTVEPLAGSEVRSGG